MIRALVIVALIFAAAAGFAWLADRPGEITLTWQGIEYTTSLMIAAIAIAILFFVIALAWWILATMLRAPRLLGDFFGGRRRERGYRALSRGMIAVGAGDARVARRAAIEAGKILKGEPLTLLLAAQSAQLSGDSAAARGAFEAMTAGRDTRLLGLRGLYIEAERSGEHEAARHYAEEAAKAAPGLAWAGTAVFDYQAAEGDWPAALLTLAANLNAHTIDRTRAHRLRAVLLTARGLDLEAGAPNEARALALEANKLAPDLVPAATLAARLYARNDEIRRAARLLEASWKRAPHPEIAEAYANVRPGDATRDRLERVEKLLRLRPDHIEGRLAVARAAIDARDWSRARAVLAEIPDAARTERACLLLAELEEASDGDRGRVREWLGRALRAPRDPAWMADGHVFEHWAPVSPISGRLDAFEWRVPAARIFAELPELELRPAEPAAGEPPLIELPAAAGATKPNAPAAPPPAAVGPAAMPAAPPLPDDPGPAAEESEARRPDTLRLM